MLGSVFTCCLLDLPLNAWLLPSDHGDVVYSQVVLTRDAILSPSVNSTCQSIKGVDLQQRTQSGPEQSRRGTFTSCSFSALGSSVPLAGIC